MTPKEKARQLIKLMWEVSLNANIAIASAIVMAEELQKCNMNSSKNRTAILLYGRHYFEQVKLEIEAFDVNEIYKLCSVY